jgi:hypothetical protein
MSVALKVVSSPHLRRPLPRHRDRPGRPAKPLSAAGGGGVRVRKPRRRNEWTAVDDLVASGSPPCRPVSEIRFTCSAGRCRHHARYHVSTRVWLRNRVPENRRHRRTSKRHDGACPRPRRPSPYFLSPSRRSTVSVAGMSVVHFHLPQSANRTCRHGPLRPRIRRDVHRLLLPRRRRSKRPTPERQSRRHHQGESPVLGRLDKPVVSRADRRGAAGWGARGGLGRKVDVSVPFRPALSRSAPPYKLKLEVSRPDAPPAHALDLYHV